VNSRDALAQIQTLVSHLNDHDRDRLLRDLNAAPELEEADFADIEDDADDRDPANW
jgi:hypothetical protein